MTRVRDRPAGTASRPLHARRPATAATATRAPARATRRAAHPCPCAVRCTGRRTRSCRPDADSPPAVRHPRRTRRPPRWGSPPRPHPGVPPARDAPAPTRRYGRSPSPAADAAPARTPPACASGGWRCGTSQRWVLPRRSVPAATGSARSVRAGAARRSRGRAASAAPVRTRRGRTAAAPPSRCTGCRANGPRAARTRGGARCRRHRERVPTRCARASAAPWRGPRRVPERLRARRRSTGTRCRPS